MDSNYLALFLYSALILLTSLAIGAKIKPSFQNSNNSPERELGLNNPDDNLFSRRSYHTLPFLPTFLSPFTFCLVHLINYGYLDIPFPYLSSPLLLERFLLPINGSPSLSGRAQPANFRWTCILHIFLLPNITGQSHNEYDDGQEDDTLIYRRYKNFLNPTISAKQGQRVPRFDYFFLFTDSQDTEVHRSWLKDIENSLDTPEGGSGYFLPAIVQLREQTNLLTYEVWDFSVVAPFAFPKEFHFISIPLRIKTLAELEHHFHSAFDLRNPLTPIGVTDMMHSSGLLFQIQPLVPPSFFTFGQDDLEEESLDLAILALASPGNNITFQRIFVPHRDDFLHYPLSPSSPWIIIRSHVSSYMSLHSTAYSFLTCDGLLSFPRPSFLLFLSAFNLTVWVALLIATFSLAFFLQISFNLSEYKQHCQQSSRISSSALSALLLPLTILLEQGINVKHHSSCITLTILIHSWSLVCVILSNAYKGQNIVELTAPLKPTLLDSFKQLVEFKFSIFSKKQQMYQFDKEEYTDHYLHDMTELMRAFYLFTDSIGKDKEGGEMDSDHPWNGENYTELRDLVENVFRQTTALNKAENRTLLETILECNRSALVDVSDTVDTYEVQLRRMRGNKFIGKGKPPFLFPVESGWMTRSVKDPSLDRRLQRILQAGIPRMWKDYRKYLVGLKMKGERKERNRSTQADDEYIWEVNDNGGDGQNNRKPLSLEGNLRVAFYLFAFILLSAFTVFGFESLTRFVRNFIRPATRGN
jgi:hypothetical protein